MQSSKWDLIIIMYKPLEWSNKTITSLLCLKHWTIRITSRPRTCNTNHKDILETLVYCISITDRKWTNQHRVWDYELMGTSNRFLWSTTDAIFVLRQWWRTTVKVAATKFAFIDIEKTHDKEPRKEVWRCARICGVTDGYVQLLQDM